MGLQQVGAENRVESQCPLLRNSVRPYFLPRFANDGEDQDQASTQLAIVTGAHSSMHRQVPRSLTAADNFSFSDVGESDNGTGQ